MEGYVICFHSKFNNKEIINNLKYARGLKYILEGFKNSQEEILNFECFQNKKIKFETFGLFFESGITNPDHNFVKILSNSTISTNNNQPKIIGGGGSDLRLPVNINKCPTVLFGPGGGPIHSVDEWVSTDELLKMLKVCLFTAIDWCEIS